MSARYNIFTVQCAANLYRTVTVARSMHVKDWIYVDVTNSASGSFDSSFVMPKGNVEVIVNIVETVKLTFRVIPAYPTTSALPLEYVYRVAKGTTFAQVMADATKNPDAGFDFPGYTTRYCKDTELGTLQDVSGSYTINANDTIYVTFPRTTFTITFKDWDGKILSVDDSVYYG